MVMNFILILRSLIANAAILGAAAVGWDNYDNK